MSHDAHGEPLLALCSVKDAEGRPLAGVTVDGWEKDYKGFYDVQYESSNALFGVKEKLIVVL
jgi:protocatechuate 3,4-dioxygenase beta subunit